MTLPTLAQLEAPFEVLAADVKTLVIKIEGAARWFAGVAEKAVAWVDAKVPGAQQAIAIVIQDGEAAMTVLEKYAAMGFNELVTEALDSSETSLVNRINASGLDLTSKVTLNADAVTTLNAVGAISQAATAAALAKVVAGTQQAAAQANQANAQVKAAV